VGFYAQVIVPLLCDFGLDRPFVARYRRELLDRASGNILEIGIGTGLNLPCYPPHVAGRSAGSAGNLTVPDFGEGAGGSNR
jgi:hypothetical protein